MVDQQFAAGVEAIVETQTRVAQQYFEDGSVEAACPPLQALLHIMACGNYHGKQVDDPSVRAMFTRESLLASDWYAERLRTKQTRDVALWQRHVAALERAVSTAGKNVREGQPLSASLRASGLVPPLAVDMIEVGESTGALPAMLNSVAEFFEEDVNTGMQATLSLIEPAIMIFMGGFVAFVLISLYLPICSLADSIR